MNRSRTRVAIAATTAALAGLTAAGSAGAAADTVTGKQVLDLLCASQAGTPFTTPFTIARCQEARANPGVEIEQLVCEGLLEGTFASVPSPGRPRRINWFCFPGPVS